MNPERIRKAQIAKDSEFLSAAGKKGAETANRNRKLRAEHKEIWEQVQEEEMELMKED